MPFRFRDACVASAIAILLAVVLTWPLAWHLGSAGRIDSGDGRHGVWNVAWVAHALSTNPTSLFDANIFHPQDGTLAYSESNVIAGLVSLPVWAVTGNPYATFNTVVLLAFAGAALSAYLLVRVVGGSKLGASVAGLVYGFSPYMFAHLPHIQLLMTFGPALSLAALHHFVRLPSVKRGSLLGATLAVTALACAYYGIFAGLVVALGLLWYGVTQNLIRNTRFWVGVAVAVAVGAVIVGPFFMPYLEVRDAGFLRSLEEARRYSAWGGAYFASAVVVHRWMLPFLGSYSDVLFPGFQASLLALFAIGLALRARTTSRATIAFYCVVGLFAFWLSLGPDAFLYTLFYRVVPAFSFLRAPVRFGVLVTLCAAVLAGLAMTWLQRRPRGLRPELAVIVLAIALIESNVGPLQLQAAPPLVNAYRRLATLPRAPVAEFPFFHATAERHRHTDYMLMSTFHWQPLINGYSDHTPAGYFDDSRILEGFPSPEAWEVIRQHNVRWIVVHFDDYPPEVGPVLRPRLEAMTNRLRLVVDEYPVSLYEVIWPMPRSVPQRP